MDDICLVTGGAGFIGCALCERLLPRFETVVAIDNLHPQVHGENSGSGRLPAQVRLIEADVADPATWRDVFGRYHSSVIIHLAAETGTGQSLLEASRHAEVNVLGLSRMLDAAASMDRKPRRIVLASSRAVYGEGAWLDPTSGATRYPGQRSIAMLDAGQWDFEGLVSVPFAASDTRCEPISVYAATKLAQEHIVRSWSAALGVDAFLPRLQNVYGPGQSLFNSYTGIVPIFARLAKAGQSIPVYEDGAITRDFVFIDDVADAMAILASDDAVRPGTYDVGSGTATTVMQLAASIANHYGAPAPRVTGQYRAGDVRHARCDIAATAAALGWAPTCALDDGLRALCAWMDDLI